jgi:ABC-2 type transport system permease protein
VWLLAAGFLVLTVGTALLSGAGGYVPLALALVTPLELLMPVLAAALGYRAILADRERGEITVLRTYPLEPDLFVWGVYCGRLAGLLVIVVGSLLFAGVLVPLLAPTPASLARTAGLDSPVYYLRFVVLTAVFAAVVLALLTLLSAVVRTARQGIVGAILFVIVIAVGLDLAVVLGLAGDVLGSASLSWVLALSPASAYRGLVMSLVVAPVATTAVRAASPIASAVSLVLWFIFPLMSAGTLIWPPASYVREVDDRDS